MGKFLKFSEDNPQFSWPSTGSQISLVIDDSSSFVICKWQIKCYMDLF